MANKSPVAPVAPVASVVETPVVETPVVETPVVETPVVETPVVETPVVETPEDLSVDISIPLGFADRVGGNDLTPVECRHIYANIRLDGESNEENAFKYDRSNSRMSEIANMKAYAGNLNGSAAQEFLRTAINEWYARKGIHKSATEKDLTNLTALHQRIEDARIEKNKAKKANRR